MNDKRKKAVLVVDDDQKNLKLMNLKLSSEGYRVITAESGFEALEAVKVEKPGLVLLDIMMPEMDGLETLKRIKAFDSNIPVAMVTASLDEEEAKKTFELGAYEYVTKPIDFEHLSMVALVKLFPGE